MTVKPDTSHTHPENKRERILVIRYGALGDMVFCFQTFHEIRKAHKDAEIALLTAPAFAKFAETMPWFDKVLIDTHPSIKRPDQWLALAKEVRAFQPKRVYELHGKLRQSILYALLGGPFGPEWSGAAPLCSHKRLWPPEPGMHFTGFLAAQMRLAGVKPREPADLAWLNAPLGGFSLPPRYAVLIPGSTPGQDYKRWPAQSYAELAGKLNTRGLPTILIGTKQDEDVTEVIKALVPDIIDLTNKTSLFELASILRQSTLVVGNDTGPMHLAAALGAPTWALLSAHTNPVWSSPPGPKVAWLQSEVLADLGVDKVLLALGGLVDNKA